MGSIASSVASETTSSNDALQGHFLYPPGLFKIRKVGERCSQGFFRFGEATCFGDCALPNLPQAIQPGLSLPDAMSATVLDPDTVGLPFDPGEIADQLRLERYTGILNQSKKMLSSARIRSGYYRARRFIPAAVRRRLQRTQLADWHEIPF